MHKQVGLELGLQNFTDLFYKNLVFKLQTWEDYTREDDLVQREIERIEKLNPIWKASVNSVELLAGASNEFVIY